MNIDEMTSDEISNLMVELEKDMKQLEENKYKINFRKNRVAKLILKLEAKKKGLQIKVDEASHLIKEKQLDLSIANKLYWKNKN